MKPSGSNLSICPAFALELADPSGRVDAFAFADVVEQLLEPFVDTVRAKMQDLLTARRDLAATEIVDAWKGYMGGWIDVLLTVGWENPPRRHGGSPSIRCVYVTDCTPPRNS